LAAPDFTRVVLSGAVRTLLLGDLEVRLAGGPDREGGGDGPLLVLFHGFGAPGTDLVPLWRSVRVPPEVRFAFPAAPVNLDPSAPADLAPRAWWMIDILRLQQTLQGGREAALALAKEPPPPGMAEARATVEAFLDACEAKLSAPRERVVLGGFSQGAMLACDVTLRTARPPAGLVLMSGAPVSEPEWRPLATKRAGLRVLQSHGRADPILPFAGGEYLRELLREGGLEVEWIAFGGGHGIPDGVLERLGPFVSEVSAPA
jgi:phospholipase/carboxylesterase